MHQLDMTAWQGRDDLPGEGPLALRWHQVVQPWQAGAEPGVTLLGFACDEGVRRNQGRAGAAAAPPALRRALASLAWHASSKLYDAGDVLCTSGQMEEAQAALGKQVATLLAEKQKPLIVGGGHETAWGTFLGMMSNTQHQHIGIINLDAHFDLRRSVQPHSGTAFAQMAAWCQREQQRFHYFCLGISPAANTQALFQQAVDLGAYWLTDEQLSAPTFDDPLRQLEQFIEPLDVLYLSIDLDVLPASVMYAVSAPAGWGVPVERCAKLIDTIARTGKLLVADIVEYNPSLDADHVCGRTAARLLWHLAQHWQHSPGEAHERRHKD